MWLLLATCGYSPTAPLLCFARAPHVSMARMAVEDEMMGMGPGEMVDAVCQGLCDNDAADTGLSRLYRFLTPQGRCVIAPPPPRSGMREGVTEQFFRDNACSPALVLLNCDSFQIVETTSVPGHETRGGLGTVKVAVQSSLHSYLASQRCFRSEGSVRAGNSAVPLVRLGTGDTIAQKLADDADGGGAYADDGEADGRDGERLNAQDPLSGLAASRKKKGTRAPPQERTLLFGLEQQRRPPLEGVWLIKEVLPLEQTLFQVLNKGSTEEW